MEGFGTDATRLNGTTSFKPNQFDGPSPVPPYYMNNSSSMTIAQRMEAYRQNTQISNGMFHRAPLPGPSMLSASLPVRPLFLPQAGPPGFLPMNMYPHPPMFPPFNPYMSSINSPISSIPPIPPMTAIPNMYPTMMLPQPIPLSSQSSFHAMRSTSIPFPLVSAMRESELKSEVVENEFKVGELEKIKVEKDAERIRKHKRDPSRLSGDHKKKKAKKVDQSANGKFANFSKDMFVIRLKDVDSFDRNNEIWRIDNHMLIQKFCGVASLRAPARQFQSTNRLAGYDSRATWRLFIINPKNVEVDKYGAEITIHNFPPIDALREAKALAEIKDEEFKSVEKQEFAEKMVRFEEKQLARAAARHKRRMEKKKRKYGYLFDSTHDNDEQVCRSVINDLLDTLDKYHGESKSIFSDESGYSDEDDVGSLHTIPASSDGEADDTESQLFPESEVPAVGLEVTVV